jgi:putative membrane protein
MVVPNWLSQYIQTSELVEIEKQIESLEQKTEAEIIPVIVRSSSNYLQAQVTLILMAALVFIVAWEMLVPHLYWDYWPRAVGLMCIGLFFIFILAPRLSRYGVLQRLLTVRSEELEQCWKRARIEFYENRLHHTADSVGVLIYISLLEHVVIVLADQKIAKKLPPDTWQKVVDQIVTGLKNKKMAQGLKNGLEECSRLLIENFPVKLQDTNELPNHVIIKE